MPVKGMATTCANLYKVERVLQTLDIQVQKLTALLMDGA
jgi:hypothetical protein